MAYRKAYEKRTSSFIGSLLVGGSSFVSVVGTYHFTNSAINPAVRLPLNFIDGNFSHVVELLTAPLIGGLIGSSLYQILNSKSGLKMVTEGDSTPELEESVENQLINDEEKEEPEKEIKDENLPKEEEDSLIKEEKIVED